MEACMCRVTTYDKEDRCVTCGRPPWTLLPWARNESRWTTRQQPPKPGREDVLPYVLRSLAPGPTAVKTGLIEREQMGKAKYGTVLQTENGRDPLVDALQEASDLVMYLGQAVKEGLAKGVAEPVLDRAIGILEVLEELTR